MDTGNQCLMWRANYKSPEHQVVKIGVVALSSCAHITFSSSSSHLGYSHSLCNLYVIFKLLRCIIRWKIIYSVLTRKSGLDWSHLPLKVKKAAGRNCLHSLTISKSPTKKKLPPVIYNFKIPNQLLTCESDWLSSSVMDSTEWKFV